MSEFYKIVLTSGLTILGGFLTFTLGQWFIIFVLEPMRKYKELVGVIDHALVLYANVIFNNNSDQQVVEKVRHIFRDFAGKFTSIYNGLSIKDRLIIAKVIPSGAEASLVRRSLIYISNTAGNINFQESTLDHLIDSEKTVRELLKIPEF